MSIVLNVGLFSPDLCLSEERVRKNGKTGLRDLELLMKHTKKTDKLGIKKRAISSSYKPLKSKGNFVQAPLAQIENYGEFLEAIKSRIQHSQVSASMAVNSHLVMLYWDVGVAIIAKQSMKGWAFGNEFPLSL